MIKKMVFAFCISLLLSISLQKAAGEPVIESVGGSVTITKGAKTITSFEIPKTQGGDLKYESPLFNLVEMGEYTITEKYILTLVNQTEEKLEFKSWQYEVKEPGNHRWSVSSSIVNPVNISSWMWLKTSVMRPIKTYYDHDISYATAHIGGRKKDVQTAPPTMSIPKGPISIDLTGDIGGSVEFSKDKVVLHKLEIPKEEETVKVEFVGGVPIETSGAYEIQEGMLLTIRATGLIGEFFEDKLRFDFPMMIPWKYDKKESGDQMFHLAGSVSNVFIEVTGDFFNAKEDIPEPQISPGKPFQLPATVLKVIPKGESYEYNMDFSATWTRESILIPGGICNIDIKASEPPGATDGIVSTNQSFIVTATVLSGNESGFLKLDGGKIYKPKPPKDEFENQFFLINKPVRWEVQAPEYPTPPEGKTITVSIDDTTCSKSIQIVTVTSGKLKIEFSIVKPPGAQRNNAVSTDQQFTVQAKVIPPEGQAPEGQANVKAQKATLDIPSGFRVEENITQTPDTEGIVKWTITAPKFETTSDFTITAEGIEENTGEVVEAHVEQPLKVEVVSKADLSVNSAKITSPEGALDGIVSTGQKFTVTAFLKKGGKAQLIGSGKLSISLPDGYELVSSIKIKDFDFKKEEITKEVPWEVEAPPTAKDKIDNITVTIESAPSDENTNASAGILVPSANVTVVGVVSRADLSVNITEPKVKGLFVTGQEFTVTAEVINNGKAGVTEKGSLKIDTGATKIILLPGEKEEKEFDLGKSEKVSVSWKLKAPSEPQSQKPINVSFGKLPLDENSGKPANVSKSSEQTQIEIIEPLPIMITAPDGAKDGVVSTGQSFTVKAEKIPSNVTKAIIYVPDGYQADEQTKTPQQGVVEWELTAPPTASPPAEIKASFEMEGLGLSLPSEPLSIKTVTAASLSIIQEKTKITSPGGATDGTVSTRQKLIVVTAILEKDGEARLTDLGELSIVLPDGYKLVSGTGNFAFDAAAKTEETEKTVSWYLEAPATAKEIENIMVKIETAPLDENTGEPAKTPVQSASVQIKTVEKGGLAIPRFAIANPDSAIDRVVSTKQKLTVEAIVTPTGTAKVINPKITIEAEGYKPEDPDKEPLKDRAVSLGVTIQWALIAPDFPRTSELKVTVRGEEENFKTEVTAENRLSVQTVSAANLQVIEVNTLKTTGAPTEGIVEIDQQFRVTAKVSNVGQAGVIGSGQLKLDLSETQVKLAQGEADVKPFFIDVPVYWNVEAPPTEQSEKLIKVAIVEFPLDENSKKPADSTQMSDKTILGVGSGMVLKITEPKGAVDGVVSTGQKFSVQNSVKVPTGVKAVNSTIEAPSGYQVDGNSTLEVPPDGIVTWKVTAPSYSKTQENITITTSFDVKPQQAKDIYIKTVQGASIEVQANITEGAQDKTLSTGQEFEVTATLTKKGEANLVGSGQLSLKAPSDYSLLSEKVRPFSEKLEDVVWKVRAPSVATNQPADITVKIEIAPDDENTNQPAEITPPGASTLKIKSVEEAAKLEVSLEILEPKSAIGGILQQNQTFTLEATVQNKGTAQVDSTGKLQIVLPNGYELIEGAKERDFIPEEQIIWTIRAPQIEDKEPQQIEVSIVVPPKDENTNQPAVVTRQTAGKAVFTTIPPPILDFLVIETLKGTLKGTSAKEAIVSTGQIFKVKNNISTFGGVKAEKSTLRLSQNYQTKEPLTQTVPENQTVEWTVTAPANPTTDFETIEVISEGKDSSGNLVESPIPHSTVRIKTVQKAILSVKDTDVEVVFPPGAQDGTVSAGQTFTVQAKVTNSGEAKTIGQGELTIVLPEGYETTPKTRPFSVDTLVEWQVTAPPAPAAQQSITVKIDKAPDDENTEEHAFILKDSEQINITTEPAATLELTDFQMPDIEKGQLDVKQQFYVSLKVNWNDTLAPSDAKINLNVPDGYNVDPGTPQERSLSEILEKKEKVIEWTVTAPEIPDKSIQQISVKISLPPLDRNTGFPAKVVMPQPIPVQTGLGALVVKLIGPDQPEEDIWNVSTDQQFTVHAEFQTAGGVSPEKYHLRLDLPTKEFTTLDSLSQILVPQENKWYSEWNVTAPYNKVTEDLVKIKVTVEETGLYSEVKVRLQTKAQLIVSQPQIIKPPEATNKENVVSTDQNFKVKVIVIKEGEADLEGGGAIKIEAEGYNIITTPERTFLPDDFLEVEGLKKLEHQWDISAPRYPNKVSSIRVTFSKLPDDDNTNKSIPQPEDKSIDIEVVQKAQVAIGKITFTPDGAADGVVSTEQTFTASVPITVSGIAKAIDIKATLSLPTGYTSPAPLERNISTKGETVTWEVKAPSTKSDRQELKVQANCTDENGGESDADATSSVTTVRRANVLVENVTVKGEGKNPFEPVTQGKDLIVDVTFRNDGEATATVTGEPFDLRLEVDGKNVTNEYSVNLSKKQINPKSEPLSFTLTPNKPKEQTTGIITINFNANNSTAWDENIGKEIPVWNPNRKSASSTIEIVIPGPLTITQFASSSEKLLKDGKIELAMKIENRGETSARVTLSVPSDLVIKNEQDKDITAEFKLTFKDAPKETTKSFSIPVTRPTAEIIYEIEPIKDRDGEDIKISIREGRPTAIDENSGDAITPIQFEPQIPKVLVDTVPPTIVEATIEARDTFENSVLKGTDVLIIQFSEAIKEPQKVTVDDFKLPVTGDKWGADVRVVETIDDKTLNIELRGLEIEVDSPLPPEQWTPEQWRKVREKSQPNYKLSKLDISQKGRDEIHDKAGNPADLGSVDIKFTDKWEPAIYHVLPPSKTTVSTSLTISAHIEDIRGRFSSGIDATTIKVIIEREGYIVEKIEYDEEKNKISQYFRANTLQFPIKELGDGTYNITIKANDRQGNKDDVTVSGITVRKSDNIILDLKSYPNPFDTKKSLPSSLGDGCVFIVFSLREPASDKVTLNINIYDVAGELVWAAKMEQAGSMTAGIAWDGKTLLGDIVPTGVYFCELLVKNGDKQERRYWRMACRPTPKKGR